LKFGGLGFGNFVKQSLILFICILLMQHKIGERENNPQLIYNIIIIFIFLNKSIFQFLIFILARFDLFSTIIEKEEE
jgi:hypothetical protein